MYCEVISVGLLLAYIFNSFTSLFDWNHVRMTVMNCIVQAYLCHNYYTLIDVIYYKKEFYKRIEDLWIIETYKVFIIFSCLVMYTQWTELNNLYGGIAAFVLLLPNAVQQCNHYILKIYYRKNREYFKQFYNKTEEEKGFVWETYGKVRMRSIKGE